MNFLHEYPRYRDGIHRPCPAGLVLDFGLYCEGPDKEEIGPCCYKCSCVYAWEVLWGLRKRWTWASDPQRILQHHLGV